MHPATMRAFPKIAKAVFNKVVEKVKEFKVWVLIVLLYNKQYSMP
jgi:hypothetical protein